MLALPGSAYLYQGEELGLPEVIDLPDEARQDPTWFRTAGETLRARRMPRAAAVGGADAPRTASARRMPRGCRSPTLWAELARDAQGGVAGSTLELYRDALAPAP